MTTSGLWLDDLRTSAMQEIPFNITSSPKTNIDFYLLIQRQEISQLLLHKTLKMNAQEQK